MTFIPYITDENGFIKLDAEQLELAFARSTILKKICYENGIAVEDAMITLAVFLGRELRSADPELRLVTMKGLTALTLQVANNTKISSFEN